MKSKKGKFVGGFLKIPDILSSDSFVLNILIYVKQLTKKVRNLNYYKLFILDLYIFDHLEITSALKFVEKQFLLLIKLSAGKIMV